MTVCIACTCICIKSIDIIIYTIICKYNKKKYADNKMADNDIVDEILTQVMGPIEADTSPPDELIILLKEWKLEQLHEFLKDQGITVDILKIIKVRHIDKLMRDYDMGTQILFEHHLEKWRDTIDAAPLKMKEPFRPRNDRSPIPTPSSCCSSPEPISYERTTLSTIINESNRAAKLVKYYETYNLFKEEHRISLINLIAEYHNDKSIHMSLTQSHSLEQDILERFPTEKLEFYRTSKRGRLYNRFFNMKQSKKFFNLESPTSRPKSESLGDADVLVPEEDAAAIIKAIKHDNLSALEFDNYWKACSKYRIQQIKSAKTTDEILQKWPEYKLPNGYRLIDIDFSVLFPQCSSILDIWESTETALFNILNEEGFINNQTIKDVLKNFNSLSQNSKEASLMWATHGCLIPWQRIVSKDDDGRKHMKRFTIRDSQNAFIVLRSSVEALEEYICQKVSNEENIQPILLVVGENLKQIKEIFVYFDGIKFPIKSIIRAIDVCFKIFNLFNFQYPKECITFWKFIEKYFFHINSKQTSAKVNILCNALDQKKNSFVG